MAEWNVHALPVPHSLSNNLTTIDQIRPLIGQVELNQWGGLNAFHKKKKE
ncbi:MAG: hypothetical protein O9264_19125 [Leptospira sp.]|nr:hypothetical protein [Leptospira sp.]